MSKGIYITRFRIDNCGNGGDRRAFQMWQYHNRPEVISLNEIPTSPVSLIFFIKALFLGDFKSITEYIFTKVFQYSKHYNSWNKPYQAQFLTYIRKSRSARDKVNDLLRNKPDFIMIDDPVYMFPLLPLLKSTGCRIIGLVHNIESLVDGQAQPDSIVYLLQKELEKMKGCSTLICISREEFWFLKNLNFKVQFVEYEPVGEIKNRMLKIREARKNSEKKGLVMVGTVNNPPTLKGMLDFRRIYLEKKLWKEYGKLVISGFGIEKFYDKFQGNNIKVLQHLSDQELDNLLIYCESFVCFQEKGAGALTKIPELLLAEVPILASEIAARTYYGKQGIEILTSNFDA